MPKYTGHPHIVSLPKFCTPPLKIDGPIPYEMTISSSMCLGCEHSQCKSGLSDKGLKRKVGAQNAGRVVKLMEYKSLESRFLSSVQAPSRAPTC